jgi:hypothetical protein
LIYFWYFAVNAVGMLFALMLAMGHVDPVDRGEYPMRTFVKLSVAAGLLAAATTAQAAVVSLDFEGIAAYPNGNNVFVQNYYNGGTASNGNSGTNFGVSFGGNALLICLNSTDTFCSNTSRGGLAPTSAQGALFFLSGSETFLNVAAGFTTGFSFNYASSVTGAVQVYDGLNGTGNLLQTVNLSPNITGCSAYGAGFCPFGAAGVSFTGTARSISFGGVANQIVFDDITFGSSTPGPGPAVPEPASWAMMIAGFGLTGAAMRRRRSTAVAA